MNTPDPTPASVHPTTREVLSQRFTVSSQDSQEEQYPEQEKDREPSVPPATALKAALKRAKRLEKFQKARERARDAYRNNYHDNFDPLSTDEQIEHYSSARCQVRHMIGSSERA
ncbi:hypothetical protein ACHEUQ_06160 [Alloscardovia omnicolens]|uniref:hypothetical protein n=1 Tax=Alloscardovia omnicolens TaxID=419015 RepID=UPI003756649B